jgi:hypothetical protein
MMSELDILRERLRLAEQRAEEAERLREQAEQQVERNNLFGLLDGCHNLSLAIKPETDATLTTQGDTTNPVNRIYPKRIIRWDEFPDLQESVWNVLRDESEFLSKRLFASPHQLEPPSRYHHHKFRNGSSIFQT